MERKKVQEVASVLTRPRLALPLVLLLATAVRLLPMRFKYLLGYDPYFHLAYTRYALKHGWVNFFPYALGPWGFQIKYFHPFGLWMTPAFVYRLLHPFGVSLYNAFRITPVIFGVLTVLLTYLAVLRLYGRREALLSAFLLSVSFGHVFRSMAGYYRGDNYMLFCYALALLGIALGLSWKPRRWKYEGLLFYTIPGISAGLSAFFWQAYYPIFAFLIMNAVLLSIGAFLLGRDEKILDGAVLALSTAIGVVVANAIGAAFNYGMVGYDRWLGRKLAKELGLHFGFIKDAFLLAYIKYALPLALVGILLLFAAGRRFKSGKERALIVGILAAGALLVFAGHYRALGLAMKDIFTNAPIEETQRTGFGDLWKAYGPSFLLAPAFLLGLRRKRPEDYLVLGLAAIAVPMLLIWTRFLFIGSLAIALLAGIGLVEVWEVMRVRAKGAAALVLAGALLLVPAVTAVEGVKTTLDVRPIINSHWVEGLTYLGEHSNTNDVVLTWWDHGHWVTYYANRAPVAQGSPNRAVAEYYLGLRGENWLESLGIDYVTVSYDTLLKFGAVLSTADAWHQNYSLLILPLRGRFLSSYIFGSGPYTITAKKTGNSWEVTVELFGRSSRPEKAFVEGKSIEKATGSGNSGFYVYVNLNYGYAVIMNAKTFNTPLARLMFTDEYPSNYRLVYSDGGVLKIFRFVHPNVAVTSENGKVALRFENATGTRIGIFGYLDNGTPVFKRWYDVKGKTEFILPENLNGSVVVRYTYAKGRTVLDRGVFRISDVEGKS